MFPRPADALSRVARTPAIAWWLPLGATAGVIALAFVWPNAFKFGVQEDGLVEYLTALVYLAVAPFALSAAWALGRAGHRPAAAAHLLLALGSFFVAGEEVSWGQRILGFEGPPELVERNNQGEANLHNLLGGSLLHSVYIAVGLYGAWLGRLVVPKLAALRPVHAFAPPPWLSAWFAVAAAYYLVVELIEPVALSLTGWPSLSQLGLARLQEPVELVLAGGVGLFVAYVRGLSIERRTDASWVARRSASGGSPAIRP